MRYTCLEIEDEIAREGIDDDLHAIIYSLFLYISLSIS